MKAALRNSFTLPALMFAVACSQGGTVTPGGKAGSGNAAGSSSGGSGPAAGGTTGDVAGAPAGGSDTGIAGSPDGTAGAATAGSGTGGSGTAGSATGGTGTGGSGTAGSAGKSGGGGPGVGGGPATALTPATFAGIKNEFMESFVNSFILMPCYGAAQQDCLTNAPGTQCMNMGGSLPMEQQGLVTHEYFTMGGDVGKMYKVTIKVTGIVEAKYYSGGTRFAGNGVITNPNDASGIDTWHTGGTPARVRAISSRSILGSKGFCT